MADLITLLRHGQSMWLDYIDRNLLDNGGLKRLVETGIRGVTSNPTIFHKAITGSQDYDETIIDLPQADHELDTVGLYKWLTIEDIQMAADILRSIYDSSKGVDGYVSLEVSPHLAHDTNSTLESARHLWKEVNRPNLMIKVPGTLEGLPAIEVLIAEGININVTLLFSVSRYEAVIQSYLRGLALNPNPGKVASVASFFVSRVDVKVDRALEQIGTPEALQLRGKIAVANARIAYQCFREMFQAATFTKLREKGARVQRPLWASTSTKNPKYSDLLYVESLIGPDTVNTVPRETLDVFLHHGEVALTLETELDAAKRDLETLKRLGINMEKITKELEDEGVASFADSYDQLLATLDEKRIATTAHYA